MKKAGIHNFPYYYCNCARNCKIQYNNICHKEQQKFNYIHAFVTITVIYCKQSCFPFILDEEKMKLSANGGKRITNE